MTDKKNKSTSSPTVPHTVGNLLWDHPEYADAEVQLGDRTWKVHLCVVCPQSDYFKKALMGPFKESKGKTIQLVNNDDFCSESIDAMFRFLYFGELQPFQGYRPLKAYKVAVYFQLEPLKKLIVQAFESGLQTTALAKNWDNFLSYACAVLDEVPFAGGPLEDALIEVTAGNIGLLVHSSGIWDQLSYDRPNFVNRVLKAVVTLPAKASTKPAAMTSAFDDQLRRQQVAQQASSTGRGGATRGRGRGGLSRVNGSHRASPY